MRSGFCLAGQHNPEVKMEGWYLIISQALVNIFYKIKKIAGGWGE